MVLDDKSFQNILTGFGQAKNGVVPVFLIHSHESFMMFMTEGMQLKAYPIDEESTYTRLCRECPVRMTIDSNYISEYPSHRIIKDVSLYKGYTKLASRSYNTEQDTAAAFQFWKEIQLRRLLGSFGPDNVTTWISVFNGRDTKHYLCGISADDQTQL